MENLPEDIRARLIAGEKPKQIAQKLNREIQELLEEVDEKCRDTVEKRKTYPCLINESLIEEKRNKLRRLVNASVSEYALDTPIDVKKLVQEVETVCESGEDLNMKNQQLKAELAQFKKAKEEMYNYRLELFEALMNSPYTPIHCPRTADRRIQF